MVQPLAAMPPPASQRLRAELVAVDASLADLVLRLLALDPARRLTAQQVT